MGTVADKLNKVLSTKDDIKAAIIEKGQTVEDSDTFASYPDKIRAIETGEPLTTLEIKRDGDNRVYVTYSSKGSTNPIGFTQITIPADTYNTVLEDVKVGDMVLVVGSGGIELSETSRASVKEIDVKTYLIVITDNDASVKFLDL